MPCAISTRESNSELAIERVPIKTGRSCFWYRMTEYHGCPFLLCRSKNLDTARAAKAGVA
jgi:hypothetical protein